DRYGGKAAPREKPFFRRRREDPRGLAHPLWHGVGAAVASGSTGPFLTDETARGQTPAGAKDAAVTFRPGDGTPMLVMGLNNATHKGQEIVFFASCGTGCLAPPAKVIHDKFGVVEGLMATARAATATQKTVDGPSQKDWRGAAQKTIPPATGAAKAVGKVTPALCGKLAGMAFRVPTPDVSVVDPTARLERPAACEQFRAAIKAAPEGELKGILGRTENEVVPTDMDGVALTSVFGVKAGISLNGRFVKLVSWCGGETRYFHKVLDLFAYISAH
ncbi:glyceraldehyde 3-phosphate dehydrogenase, cytosolic, putative, partial [Trypanosoma cruzi marinkellei]